jgi:Na+-translocating ferredoxin:NAD+ oxidoreductase subunit C
VENYINDKKALTKNKEIITITPKNGCEMVYPLSQYIGEACKPIVSVGERVLVGQKIGDSDQIVSSPIHSSVSGIVKEFREVPTVKGTKTDAIIIENDGKFEEIQSMGTETNYLTATKKDLINIIREAGIVGLGGAGFPTHVKLNPPSGAKIEYIIANGIECEPYLTNDYRLMLESCDNLITGIKITMSLFEGAKAIIAIATDKPDAIEILKEKTKDTENIEIMTFTTSVSQGAEARLIKSCLNRDLPLRGRPLEVGCIVCNVGTLIAIEEAVVKGKPHLTKNVTVSGDLINVPQNVKAYIGASHKDLIEACGGVKRGPFKTISGGHKMGFPITDLSIPITKATSGVLCFSEEVLKMS